MKLTLRSASAAAAVLLASLIAVSDASATQAADQAVAADEAQAAEAAQAADVPPVFTLSTSTVQAGKKVVLSSDGWSDLTGEELHPTYVYLISAAEGLVASGTTSTGAGPWSFALKVPGERRDYEYDAWPTEWEVCVTREAFVYGGCRVLTVTAPPIPVVDVHRFWSPTLGNAHIYTTNADEVAHIRATDPSWVYEGQAFSTVAVSADGWCTVGPPVYRFYSPVVQSHFYTQSFEEKQHLVTSDPNWTYEGIAYCAPDSPKQGSVPLYRFWSSAFGKHFYTANQAEADHLKAVDRNWSYEGIAYYVWPLGTGGRV
ncbi:hypothetical protein [Cellulomonas xylanilytica]|uniref:DUF5648 domain-containing protein n=1 Tax=Cellulomonas xylanilytica TaxID=233583 RepID=A0A510V2X5_9CELL|nr:hypothetical protein [Cellulomonas xylanilytica]GEK21218.1 hypothetical protein CXY01_17380 [Cellulomonas xylanilytica]